MQVLPTRSTEPLLYHGRKEQGAVASLIRSHLLHQVKSVGGDTSRTFATVGGSQKDDSSLDKLWECGSDEGEGI